MFGFQTNPYLYTVFSFAGCSDPMQPGDDTECADSVRCVLAVEKSEEAEENLNGVSVRNQDNQWIVDILNDVLRRKPKK